MKTEDVQIVLKPIACHVDHEDIQLICKYAKAVNHGEIMVDLGTAFGKSCGAMALVNPDVPVYTLDIEKENHVKLNPIPNNLFFLKGNSHTYPWDQEIAMMNIDADHTYEGVKADIDHWVKYVKEGGYIVFHDYLMPEFGVKQAVDEYVENGTFKFLETAGLSCAVQVL